ncbi:MAG: SMP-30/gluconolactonase/LRE family protein [Bacteroidota bacterium]
MQRQANSFLCLFLSGLLGLSLIGCGGQANQQTQASMEKTSEETTKTYPTVGEVERLDPAIDALIPTTVQIEVLGEGMQWSEGPIWLEDKQLLLCSDVPENKVYQWSEQKGFGLFLEPSGFTGEETDSREKGSNGLTLDPQGRLTLCQHGDRRVARYTGDFASPSPSFETVVDRYEGKRFNSPNDLVFDSKGNLYFTDPPYGLSGAMMDDPKKELPFQGVFKYTAEGELHLLTDQLSRPNGLALSPDETILYVANSDPEKAVWMAYPLLDGHKIGEGKLFYDATPLVATDPGLPDGLKLDAKGNLYATGPGGLWIFSPEGKVLGKVKAGKLMSNCNFDNDKKTLFITADDLLLRLRL